MKLVPGSLLLSAALAWLASCGSCRQLPGPPPSNPAAEAPIVWQELYEGGYVTPDDAGPAGILSDYNSDARAPWLDCLFRGGSPSACNVPSEPSLKE